jgi:hypothetical protein
MRHTYKAGKLGVELQFEEQAAFRESIRSGASRWQVTWEAMVKRAMAVPESLGWGQAKSHMSSKKEKQSGADSKWSARR